MTIFTENVPNFSSAYELSSQAELMPWPVVRHPSVPPSLLLSVNFGGTNRWLELGSPYVVHRHLGWLALPNLDLGHSDLLCGFYRPKFTFLMYFNGKKICLSLDGFWQQDLFQFTKCLSLPRPSYCVSSLSLTSFSRSQQTYIFWIRQIWMVAHIFYKQVIKLLWVYCCLLCRSSTNMGWYRQSSR